MVGESASDRERGKRERRERERESGREGRVRERERGRNNYSKLSIKTLILYHHGCLRRRRKMEEGSPAPKN